MKKIMLVLLLLYGVCTYAHEETQVKSLTFFTNTVTDIIDHADDCNDQSSVTITCQQNRMILWLWHYQHEALHAIEALENDGQPQEGIVETMVDTNGTLIGPWTLTVPNMALIETDLGLMSFAFSSLYPLTGAVENQTTIVEALCSGDPMVKFVVAGIDPTEHLWIVDGDIYTAEINTWPENIYDTGPGLNNRSCSNSDEFKELADEQGYTLIYQYELDVEYPWPWTVQ